MAIALLTRYMLMGEKHVDRANHFGAVKLVTCGLHEFIAMLGRTNDTLFVTHASRSDIVLAFLAHAEAQGRTGAQERAKNGGTNGTPPFTGGLVLAGGLHHSLDPDVERYVHLIFLILSLIQF